MWADCVDTEAESDINSDFPVMHLAVIFCFSQSSSHGFTAHMRNVQTNGWIKGFCKVWCVNVGGFDYDGPVTDGPECIRPSLKVSGEQLQDRLTSDWIKFHQRWTDGCGSWNMCNRDGSKSPGPGLRIIVIHTLIQTDVNAGSDKDSTFNADFTKNISLIIISPGCQKKFIQFSFAQNKMTLNAWWKPDWVSHIC